MRHGEGEVDWIWDGSKLVGLGLALAEESWWWDGCSKSDGDVIGCASEKRQLLSLPRTTIPAHVVIGGARLGYPACQDVSLSNVCERNAAIRCFGGIQCPLACWS